MYKTSPAHHSLNNPTQRAGRGSSVDRDDIESNATQSNGHSNGSASLLLPRRRVHEVHSPSGKSKAARCSFFDIQTRYGNLAYLISLTINIILLIVICLSFYTPPGQCLAENQLILPEQGITDLSSDITPPIIEDRDHQEEEQAEKPSIIEPIKQPSLNEESNKPAATPDIPPIKPVDQSKDKSPVNQEEKPSNQKVITPSLIQPGEGGNRAFFVDDASDHLGSDAHQVHWDYCLSHSDSTPTIDASFRSNYILNSQSFPWEACATEPTAEQSWQITWYGGQVAVGVTERQFPLPQRCVALPPPNYKWPTKYTALPAVDQSFFHWTNLRVQKFEDLIVFNQGAPKNLYHFEAPRYDLDGLEELTLAAQHIPFKSKIRTFLDIGAGGASLGLLMRRKYRVETISVIFPDWPYCEYITERGGMCVLVDAMEAMPFARGAFDVVHISWVYHGQHPHELVQMYMEIDRLVRPGGYVWQRGGFSLKQIETMKHLFDQLGYTALHDKVKLIDREKVRIQFGEKGDIPFEAEWSCIYVKPTSAVKQVGCKDPNVPEYGTVKSPV